MNRSPATTSIRCPSGLPSRRWPATAAAPGSSKRVPRSCGCLPRIANKYVVTEEGIGTFQTLLRAEAELVFVPPAEVVPVTGDPEDDYVLATARLRKADYLVTRDKGLLALGRHTGIPVVSPGEFWQILNPRGSE